MSIFSERLKELRGAESQASFATSIALNRVQYAKYEGGQNSPSVEVLERICRVHACSADWLLGLKDKSPSVSAGPGAAVAIGSNARATSKLSTLNSPTPNCTKCPHLKKLKKLEALLKQ